MGNMTGPRAGDIGKPLRKVEFEPLPDDVPVAEPSPDVTPEREPVLVPA
jgi:hypothetical protein